MNLGGIINDTIMFILGLCQYLFVHELEHIRAYMNIKLCKTSLFVKRKSKQENLISRYNCPVIYLMTIMEALEEIGEQKSNFHEYNFHTLALIMK